MYENDDRPVPGTPAPPPPPAAAPAAPVSARARRSPGWFALVVATLLSGLIGAAVMLGVGIVVLPGVLATRSSGTPSSVLPVSGAKTSVGSVLGTEPIETVAAKVTPSVVNVGIERVVSDPFTGRSGTRLVGNGSGVIIRADGYILTNNHVVEGADRLIVRIGTEDLTASVVGTDPETDLAVIRVKRTGLPAIEFGSSASLKVGETVVAVGSPFGLEKSVTSGIVSALHRSDIAQRGEFSSTIYTNLIQTDAAINPGNSGGALVDLKGRLVGINTLISSPSGGLGAAQSSGVGFAIPIDAARNVAEQLIATGKAQHAFVGVSSVAVAEAGAQATLPTDSGAIIQDVQPGSPGSKAGLKVGDIVVKIGDTVITGPEDLYSAVRNHRIGDVVEVRLWRDDSQMTITVTLGSDAAAR